MREKTLSKISDIYHKHHGVDGYRSMQVFENKIQQNFSADEINQKWCTDFTYLFLVLYALKDFLIKRLGSLLEHTT